MFSLPVFTTLILLGGLFVATVIVVIMYRYIVHLQRENKALHHQILHVHGRYNQKLSKAKVKAIEYRATEYKAVTLPEFVHSIAGEENEAMLN